MTTLQTLLAPLNTVLQDLGIAAVSFLRISAIIIGAWIVLRIAQRAVRTLRERIASRLDDNESAKRADTLGRVVRYLVAVVVTLVAGMLVLSELGVSVAPILGAAGVAGLAVGFGAQSLVKDYFTGFFLLVEDQIRQGDVVKLGDHAGQVEEVTLRYVQLRDYDGNVHFVPNGTITHVVNFGRGHAHAVIEIGVAYSADLDRAMNVMKEVGALIRLDPAFAARILGDLEVAGVERWADAAVFLKARLRVKPLAQWDVRREFLRRLKPAFDQAGIELPPPTVRPAAAAALASAPVPPVASKVL